jgi:hypothetical protein
MKVPIQRRYCRGKGGDERGNKVLQRGKEVMKEEMSRGERRR